MGEAKSGGTVSTYTVIGTVDANGKAQAVSGSIPLSVDRAVGTFAYSAGTNTTTVDVPAGAKLRRVSVIAGSAASATVTIGGGDTITIPAGGVFDEDSFGATLNLDVVIGGTIQSRYVSWTT